MLGSRTDRCLVAVATAAALAVPLSVGNATSATPAAPAAAPSAAPAFPSPGGPGAGDPYFPFYGNRGYSVQHYGLQIRYNPATNELRGIARIRARAHKDLSRLNLDLVGFHVQSVAIRGRRTKFTRARKRELVVWALGPLRTVRKGHMFTVRVRYRGIPQVFHTPGLGPSAFLATSDGATAIGEPEVSAFWFPSNDHPSDKATYRVTLTVPRRLDTVSNGLPSATTVHGRWATTTWQARDPMASYLAFMSVGRYDVHRWTTAAGLPMVDAVDSRVPANVKRRINASLARQGEILRAETRWFGPYPFETAGAVVDRLPAAFALENQTRPTYVPVFWEIPTSPTLGDDVVVHELAHQWFGDTVSVERWRDIWLNEGFATYAEWLWNQREHGFSPRDFFNHYFATPAKDDLWSLRIGNPQPAHMFDLPVYIRGALTLQALRMRIGTVDFFRVLRTWARRHADRNGNTTQFVRLSERVSGRNLDRLFDAWLFTATKPQRPATGRAASAFAAPDPATAAAVRGWERGVRLRVKLAHGSGVTGSPHIGH
jgi:aminopeptidase N